MTRRRRLKVLEGGRADEARVARVLYDPRARRVKAKPQLIQRPKPTPPNRPAA